MLGGIISSFLIFSCKKESSDTSTSNPDEVHDNYLPLEVGNYWVYKYNEIDSANNNITSVTKYDTVTVVGKVMVNNKDYFKTEHSNMFGNYYVNFPVHLRNFEGRVLSPKKDSNGNYLNEEFVSFDMNVDTLTGLECDDQYVFWTSCELQFARYNLKEDTLITTNAGNFNTKVVQHLYKLQPGWQYWGADRKMNYYYSKDVGLIRTEKFAFSSTGTMFWELVDYDLN